MYQQIIFIYCAHLEDGRPSVSRAGVSREPINGDVNIILVLARDAVDANLSLMQTLQVEEEHFISNPSGNKEGNSKRDRLV